MSDRSSGIQFYRTILIAQAWVFQAYKLAFSLLILSLRYIAWRTWALHGDVSFGTV